MDHGADAGIGQQLQEQRMGRSTVNDVGTKYAAGKRIDGRTQLRNHALIDLADVYKRQELRKREAFSSAAREGRRPEAEAGGASRKRTSLIAHH